VLIKSWWEVNGRRIRRLIFGININVFVSTMMGRVGTGSRTRIVGITVMVVPSASTFTRAVIMVSGSVRFVGRDFRNGGVEVELDLFSRVLRFG
jgi:hypothetical protein